MKKFVFAALMLASSTAFARGSDYSFVCQMEARNARGHAVSYRTREIQGPWHRARTIALRECRQSGLRNCRTEWCRQVP